MTVATAQGQIDALHQELAEQRLMVTTMKATVDAQALQTAALYHKLMELEPGEAHSLLDRMAAVTRAVESGGRVQDAALKLAKVLAAIGAIAAALHWGQKV